MPQANQRVGEYLLDEKIGAGAFGEVWRARHHVWSDRLVAIKIPTDPQYVRRLQHEGAAIHGLVHPNIVRALGFDPFAQVPYLTMQYVPGTSLRPLIRDKALRVVDAVAILRQVLTGLRCAHDHGVIHRDIKPENVLIDQRAQAEGYDAEGVVKVTDFGMGRLASGGTSLGSIALSVSLNTPEAKEIAGTLDYMSPEQRAGGEVDHRTDLYACGVMLHEMLTGERPAGTEVPSDLMPGVSPGLDEVFRRSYARLDKRFTSADEFLAALAPQAPPPLPGGAVPSRTPPLARVSGHRVCPQCRHGVDTSDQFCMHCGMQLVPEVRRCGNCGAYPGPGDGYCIFCGQGLEQSAAESSRSNVPDGIARLKM